jgi:MFS transporter, DHA2 family, multidrug resistance protein
MAVLDIQITNASLRYITGGISATEDEGSWIPTSYLIGEIITIPLTAWLSRVFSVRWYLLVNVILFLIFSCLCGTAHELVQMILYRAGQGFTGGVMIPIALTVALSSLPKDGRDRGLAFGVRRFARGVEHVLSESPCFCLTLRSLMFSLSWHFYFY